MNLINNVWEWLQTTGFWAWFQGLPLLFKVLVIATITYSVFSLIFGRKCPKCHKRRALKRTGKKRTVGESEEPPIQDHSFWTTIGKFFATEEDEWACKYYQHRVWREIRSSGGGGNGGNGG